MESHDTIVCMPFCLSANPYSTLFPFTPSLPSWIHMQSPEIGAHRSRSETSKLYISPIHSSLDRTGYPDASAGEYLPCLITVLEGSLG
jgi:hypothetical protein